MSSRLLRKRILEVRDQREVKGKPVAAAFLSWEESWLWWQFSRPLFF